LFVCKNHVAGRQYRTLAQHLPKSISNYIPFGFNAVYRGTEVSRENWMSTEIGRARVFGEYLRIIYLGGIGHTVPLEKPIEGLEDYIKLNLNQIQ
jgi:hypothetical protein